jgi:threonine dehydratase
MILATKIPDRPGGLARLLGLVADAGANVIDVEHLRDGMDLHVRETAVQLVLQTRGPDHDEQILAVVREAGYEPSPELLRGDAG